MRMTKEALDKQDGLFAKRLARRDESVIKAIEGAYAAQLRQLLARSRGPALDEHDIDDIVARTLEDTWNGFDQKQGASVRAFFFHVAKRRLQDRLRRNSRRRQFESRGPRVAHAEVRTEPPADAVIIDREIHGTHGRIIGMIGEAVAKLTERQRTAFKRRFAAGGGKHWAQRLETETGTPAKRW